MSIEYREACALAMAIYKRRYRTQSPKFELCPDTVGVITQIDNMVAGLFSDIESAAQHERHRIYAALESDPGALWRDQGFQEWRAAREAESKD